MLLKLALLLVLISSLFSKELSFINQSIETLFDKKQYDEACLLANTLFKQNPDNYLANIYYGRCANYRGYIDKAMAAYDRAEIINDEDFYVHKHLGDLYTQIGNIEIANEEYDKADRFGNQPVIRERVSNYNANTFSLFARLNIGEDSNVNYSAELSEMAEWGAYAEPESDSFTKEYMKLTHVYDSDPFSTFYYKSQLHAYNKNYTKLHEEDFAQENFYTGPGWASNTFDFWIPLGYIYMTTDYEGYAEIYSIEPQISTRFENEILLKLETSFEYQKYLQWNEGNKLTYSGKLSFSRWFSKNYLRVAYHYLQTDKNNKESPRIFIDKYFHEIEFNYTRRVTKSLEAGVGFLYRKTSYMDLAKLGIDKTREDVLYSYSGYLSYNVTQVVGVVLSYENYENQTNYTPSDYNKEVLSLGLFLYL